MLLCDQRLPDSTPVRHRGAATHSARHAPGSRLLVLWLGEVGGPLDEVPPAMRYSWPARLAAMRGLAAGQQFWESEDILHRAGESQNRKRRSAENQWRGV